MASFYLGKDSGLHRKRLDLSGRSLHHFHTMRGGHQGAPTSNPFVLGGDQPFKLSLTFPYRMHTQKRRERPQALAFQI
jgi:hypothetical protein